MINDRVKFVYDAYFHNMLHKCIYYVVKVEPLNNYMSEFGYFLLDYRKK